VKKLLLPKRHDGESRKSGLLDETYKEPISLTE
jgi:hypothetical protein